MSEREALQRRIERKLTDQHIWTAPYGILSGLHPVKPHGYVRTITFGVARTLDATVFVWSPKRIEIDGRGALAYLVSGTFDSEEALMTHLAECEARLT
jgi:hypothetical protein